MKKFKILIDVLLFIVTILLFDIELIGNLNHEILGIAISILILIHIILNFKWIKQVTKNFKKVNSKINVTYVVDAFTMLIYLGAIICGVMISDKIFNFHMGSNLYIMLSHLIFGRLAIIIMFIHLGMHLDRLLNKIKSSNFNKVIYIIYIIIILLILIYLIYTLTHSFQWLYAFGKLDW